GRAPPRLRPCRAAPAQSRPAERDALSQCDGPGLRQRRLSGRHGARGRAGRLEGLRGAPRRSTTPRPPSRHRPVQLSRAEHGRAARLAAWLLEAAEPDVEFARGRFGVKGTDRTVGLFDVARAALRADVPAGLGGPLAGESDETIPVPSFPYGCAVCEVEVDPE